MEIRLSPETERLVEEFLTRGAYPSASALVEDAVHRLMETDQAEAELEDLVRKGIESGPAREISAADWQQLREEVRARHASRTRG